MRTAAVVVTHNRRELLVECLEALLGQQAACLDILVVDNASQDDTQPTVAEMARKHDQIIYMNTGANLGGAGGFHFGSGLGHVSHPDGGVFAAQTLGQVGQGLHGAGGEDAALGALVQNLDQRLVDDVADLVHEQRDAAVGA